ncbi:FAD-binding oxidoreductase [Megalodesulfovibrio gigas]|uniref:Putative glycolate oxidase subunit GlcD n=1 Tax=Megalodesulfovibrio gigas (strain ATCC 19364 / DSM 1382 / NCIMB 9332 / VKM B-1759) TaxID=1121448 RepID=T2GF69_MEGG1|nr:FAD-linked oxidase C-terminal domain-containing protein [Megalodesulfovibrio gigas]AGW14824.1 putative glycolate oxidase subunit GlcD [Megalodesulfovibrio gigas DSM 1382 = ATCC 19364]
MPAVGAGLTPAQRRSLERLFPGEQSLFDAESMLVYGLDACRQQRLPWAVVRPACEAQLVELLRWAQAERVPIVPRARATNTVGGCVPAAGGVVVSLLSMNTILEIDDHDFVAVVEPGVITGELQRAVEARGLFYPPDPASGRMSSIGGNVATCAGGMRALKYGVTRDHVLGLRVVLPGGEIIETGGRTHKNVVGLDLTRLLVGSEGTLGVISRIILKLQPKPQATASLLAAYGTMDACLAASRAVFAAGMLPAAMEFMGRGMCRCLEQLMPPPLVPWPASTNAVLLLRLDGDPECLAASLARAQDAVTPFGPVYLELAQGREEEALWDIRRSINPASFKAGSKKLSDDVTLPRGRVLQALTRFEAIGEEAGVRVLFAGHLGDGNMHVSVMHEPGQEDAAARAKAAIQETTMALGGSLSGEHGIGLVKLAVVDKQLGAVERRLMRQIKQIFDPHGILNPGKAY